jgi:tetratricopeptide (TPR) repeat protein
LVGISLAAFDAIILQAGGRAALAATTTSALKRECVLPRTRQAASSAVDWLIASELIPASARGRANVFISHAYDYTFIKVVEAVRAWEARQPAGSGPFFYYFDLLVVNQHGQGAVVPFEALRDEFGGGVRGIGRTLLFLDWHAPIALQRAWCVFEIFTSLDVAAEFQVIMAPSDEASFEAALVDDLASLVQKTCVIDAEAAEAREPCDLANIQAVIREREGGFLAVNQLIVGALKEWMVSTGTRALDRIADLDERATGSLVHNLACMLQDQGRLAEAGPYLEFALEGRRRLLGPQHLSTLACADSLAMLLLDQGKLSEAEVMFASSLESFRAVRGDAHPDTLSAMHNLARVLHDLGRSSEAEPLLAQCLAGKRAVLGPLAASTLGSISNLAIIYIDRGDLKSAEPLLREALDGNRRLLGATHPETLVGMNNLARVLLGQGQLVEARGLFEEALALRRRTLGDRHPRTLISVNNLASVLQDLGELRAAAALYREALLTKRAVLGNEHQSTLISVHNMGTILADIGEFEEAHALATEAVAGLQGLLGPANPTTLSAVNNLGRVLQARGDLVAADGLLLHVLEERTRALGPKHARTLSSLVCIGSLRSAQAAASDAGAEARGLLYAAAQRHFSSALAGLRETLGDEHPDTRACVEAFARMLAASGRADEAAALLPELERA